MEGYLYMEDRGEISHGQRWGTPVTPLVRREQALASREDLDVMPRSLTRSLIALDKAALGVSEDWREHQIALRYAKRKESSVRVVCRFRPPSISDRKLEAEGHDCERAFRVLPGGRCVDAVEGGQNWEFDVAFAEECSQEAVYNAAGKPVIDALLDGYNGTIFAYGQTGSGKTHCMFGPSHELMYQASESRGIVPRTVQHVFNHIRDGIDGTEFVLRCSLFEVYREQLRDLLDPANPNLRIKETPRRGVFVDGLAEEFVACEDDVVRLLRGGFRLRAVAATRLNQHSSRSHVIFSLTCEQRLVDGTEKLAKLNLVDLAGSEKVWKSSSCGVTLEEAKKINLSLSALGNVINALASHKTHVPYRNSKLTRILQETLGGNFKTALVVTCSPLRMHLEETYSSLHFATRAKAVCNHVKVNFVYSAEQLMAFAERLQQELLFTRQEIAKHGGGLPVSPSEAPVVSEYSSQQLQHFQWDAPSGATPASASCAAVPKQQKKPARLVLLADEIKPVLLKALSAQEELIGELKAIKGAGLAHELRASLIGSADQASMKKPCQAVTLETLCIQQRVFHKLLRRQSLARELAAQHRSRRVLEGGRAVVTSSREYLDAQLVQLASDLQIARETLAETSRAHEAETLTLADRSEVSIMLRSEEGGAQGSSTPEQMAQLSQAITAVAVIQAQTLGDGEDEVSQLREELDLLKVDSERQSRMHHLVMQETRGQHQQWYQWAKGKLADMDHSDELALLEEQRLTELVERRRMEISKAQERVTQRKIEILAKQHESRVTDHLLTLQRSAEARAAAAEDARMSVAKVQRDELDDAMARVKVQRDGIQDRRPERWAETLGA